MRSAPSGLDLVTVRERFPALTRIVAGRPCVFADAPGGTQVPRSVIEAMSGYLIQSNANTGGAFATSRETDELIAEARRAAADFLGAEPDQVVFGANMTTLAFALSRSMAGLLGSGDEVVLTVLDHDANVAPWMTIAQERGAAVRWVDVTGEDCTLSLDSLDAALSERTKVVAFTLASNAVGTITPSKQIVRLVRERAPRAVVVADAVHAAQHRLIDFEELGADVVFCSAYKFFGPHVGLMVGRPELLETWPAYRVRPADDLAPWRWETGTLNHEGLAGLVAAVEYVAGLGRHVLGADGQAPPPDRRLAVIRGFSAIAEHETALTERFLSALPGLPAVRLFGIAQPARATERTPTFALLSDDRSPRDVAQILGERGVFVWDGNYYALAIMQRLGLEPAGGAVRIGFCHYHTLDEVDRVIDELAHLGA